MIEGLIPQPREAETTAFATSNDTDGVLFMSHLLLDQMERLPVEARKKAFSVLREIVTKYANDEEGDESILGGTEAPHLTALFKVRSASLPLAKSTDSFVEDYLQDY